MATHATVVTAFPFQIRAQGRGELLISLCWQPAAARLTVVLLKARNLPRMDVTGLADPYVKIYLLYNGQRIAKKKTHIKKRTLSPVFNESFAFDIPTTEVRWTEEDKTRGCACNNKINYGFILGRRSELGRCILGVDAARLGPGHEERGDWPLGAGWTTVRGYRSESLERGVQLTTPTNCRVAQVE